MATTVTQETLHRPALGEPGEPCARCGAPLAADQRYCLECGARRGPLPFEPPPAGPAPLPVAPAADPAPSEPRSEPITPSMAAIGVGLAVLFLGVGVLVGKAGDDGGGSEAASKPTVVTVAGGAPAAGATGGDQVAAATAFTSDWPAGEEGWTVQLQVIAKDGADASQVEDAKNAASDKGAGDVGALDSDQFASLDGGNYVVYSGHYGSKGEAQKALGKLKQDFPDARVVKVGSGGGAAPNVDSAKAKADQQAVQNLQNLSGSDYAKQSQKLPKEVATPGAPPPKDDKEGGGGSGFDTID
jgi:hypothetical protein